MVAMRSAHHERRLGLTSLEQRFKGAVQSKTLPMTSPSGASSAQSTRTALADQRDADFTSEWICFRAVSLQPHETSSSGSALGLVKTHS